MSYTHITLITKKQCTSYYLLQLPNVPDAILQTYTDIFKFVAGDRQNVSNMMILVLTHDVSEDLRFILQQVALAELRGIHVIAIGKINTPLINLSNISYT